MIQWFIWFPEFYRVQCTWLTNRSEIAWAIALQAAAVAPVCIAFIETSIRKKYTTGIGSRTWKIILMFSLNGKARKKLNIIQRIVACGMKLFFFNILLVQVSYICWFHNQIVEWRNTNNIASHRRYEFHRLFNANYKVFMN
jgi:hypothetical protein